MFKLFQLGKWHLIAIFASALLSLAPEASAKKTDIIWDNESGIFMVQDETVKSVLNYIENNSDYIFIYDNAVNSMLSQKVSVSVEGRKIEDVLKAVCTQASLSYSISGRQVAIWPAGQPEPVLKDVKIHGTVIDESGYPLIGAAVMVKGTTTGVITDLDGKYSITAPAGATLEVSYTGYVNFEMAAPFGGGEINVTLNPDSRLLDEVVVVGYGTQKKINLTGAVDVVTAEEIGGRSASNTSSLLVGVVPNMNITQANGRPGQGASINIRGVNSISSNGGPLVLIDGVEGTVDSVNPNDIESISVLKDASAAAVYGARAAYGVILITTKSGSDGKAHVSYTGRFSFNTPTTSTDYETRGYYSAAINDYFMSGYQGSNYTAYDSEDYYQLWIRRNDKTEHPDRPWTVIKDGQYKYYANFDWYNYLFDDTRPTHEHDLSIYGGNKNLNYRISAGYYGQEGVLNVSGGDHYKRYNVRSKLSAQITPWLKVSNNTYLYSDQYDYPGAGAVATLFNRSNLHALASFLPVNPDGTAVHKLPGSVNGTYTLLNGHSVVLADGRSLNVDKKNTFGTTFEAVITPIEHLNITANYSYIQHESWNVNRRVQAAFSQTPGVVEVRTDLENALYDTRDRNWYNAANVFANYDNTFNGHHVGATVGGNYETRFYSDLAVYKDGLISDELNDFNLAQGEKMTITGGKNRYAIIGAFYRLNYDYKGRYLLELSGRYDGSSRFPKGIRFGYFPSASAGWRIDQEPFFGNAKKVVNLLKLRASYGKLGNQNIGYYDYVQTVNTGGTINYAFGGSQLAGSATVSAPNASDFTWETVTNMNIGLDIEFLDGRLSFTGDAYIRDTDGMLMATQDLPSVYGASAPKGNAASLRSKGWEVSVNWKDNFQLAGKPFHYGVGASLADYVSHVRSYNNENKTIGTPYAGQRLGEMWGYVVDGYFLSDEEAANYPVDQSYVNSMINVSNRDQGLHAGDLKFVDMDGDGKISPTLTANDIKDQVVIGNSLPRYTYAINLNASWNGIDLSALFQGVGYQNWYPGGESYQFWGPYSRPFQTYIASDFLSKIWSEDNPDAYFPRPRGWVAFPGDGGPRELTVVNTKYLQNVGYFRLKNLTVGYTLPKKWLDTINAEKIRLYFSGENLFTASPIETDYIDPSLAGGSTSWQSGHTNVNGYPLSKVFSFGVDITF